jgi:hypothetical protein
MLLFSKVWLILEEWAEFAVLLSYQLWDSSRKWLKDISLVNNPCKEDYY